ncbi:PREDICTED: rab-like protein 3 [Priapulus caudatus]|uniref:Rab-like protein 3 n=1 Tax=Priapulus caudatus TaxID=37621 RepID=A0ABM1EYQ2_PRICU|nr:PREDICTED: rab-like protein 3 [Priapulus caudatus]XP_014677323.1 PREDICTED: rab-like protein 3 [Priapulus caudatus]
MSIRGNADERSMFVELWDIGGSNSYRNSRSIFYTPVHGLLLVHDLTNRKSQHNLRKWLGEVLSKSTNTPFSESESDYDPEQFAGCSQYPILVVGTKADLAQGALDASGRHRASSVAEDCLVDEMNIDCHNTKYVAPGSSNAVKISRFFDKVIEKQFYSHAPSAGATIGSFFDRRKPAPLQRPFSPPARTKLLHAD